jgi:hypothetical protein
MNTSSEDFFCKRILPVDWKRQKFLIIDRLIDHLVTNSYNIAVRKRQYRNWKNIGSIQEAEKMEREMMSRLDRDPTKKDFKDAGLYHVWMALYRYRRKMQQQNDVSRGGFSKEYLFAIRKQMLLNPLMRKHLGVILEDCVLALGPDEAEKILDKIWSRRFQKLRSSYKVRGLKKLGRLESEILKKKIRGIGPDKLK